MKAVFFDRDGIVNVPPPEGGYVLDERDLHVEPFFPDVLRTVQTRGFAAVVVTNQRCVARGLISLADLDAIHAGMRQSISLKHGLQLLDVLCCPHGPDECDCRKPLPGLLLEAARRHGIDLNTSWMIGDRMTDVEAGYRAGCRTILVGSVPDGPAPGMPCRPDHVCRDMEELRNRITEWI